MDNRDYDDDEESEDDVVVEESRDGLWRKMKKEVCCRSPFGDSYARSSPQAMASADHLLDMKRTRASWCNGTRCKYHRRRANKIRRFYPLLF
jgi:hypothetical protein